ncbi:MAG: hypothetical protein CM15mL4_2940 [uncultured marine virus]|nr:MAG: hypothetical protein CM15mL4_2940 [uncultured marine virus]
MVLTFNYSEKGVKDPRPFLLFLYDNNGILGKKQLFKTKPKFKKNYLVLLILKKVSWMRKKIFFLKRGLFQN